MQTKPRIIFFGTPDFVLPVLRMLHETYAVVAVVSAPDQITGRKKLLTPTPVKQYAHEQHIPVILTPTHFDESLIHEVKALEPDLFIVAAYGKIIPMTVLQIPRFGAINIHPSLLPKYRGPSPIQSALRNGETETGITIMQMDKKMDHGPILAQEIVPLAPTDTFASLHTSLFEKATDLLKQTIEGVTTGKLTPTPQDDAQASYCQMITRDDGYFDHEAMPEPQELDRMIRAYYPWPSAWTKVDGKIIKFLPEERVQMEGKKVMTKKEFLNGYPQFTELVERVFQ